MHVLITGGAGFIGSHLVDYHLTRGDSVHVVDDLSTGSKQNLAAHRKNPNLRLDKADVLTWSGLATAVAWADRIYHMAAVVGMYRVLERPIQVLATNIAGTERLLRAVDKGGWRPQVVIASSSEVYGPRPEHVLREDCDLVIRSGAVTRWNYAVSKLADEALALSYARHLDLPVTIVRLFNTVGPRQTGRYGMVLPRFVKQAVAGDPITVYGDGTQSRCFCDVRDTVFAFDLLASNHRSQGQIVNVGNDREITIRQLAELVRERAGSTSPIHLVPYLKAYGEGFEDIPHRRPYLGRLMELTEFHPRIPLEETVDRLLASQRAEAPVETPDAVTDVFPPSITEMETATV